MRVIFLRCFAAVLTGALLLETWAQAQVIPTRTTGNIRIVRQAVIEDAQINESSGLAASRRFKGSVWTHNDSGDTPRVFLLDSNGVTRSIVLLAGAQAIDWEDMAIAGSGNDAQVYIGDIGDNQRKRTSIQVYRFSEDQIHPSNTRLTSTGSTSTGLMQTVAAQKMTLRYPDGAHDAETLIATQRGEIVIVAKEIGACRLYKTAKPFVDNTTQTLVLIGRFQFDGDNFFARLPTGGDLNAREDRFVVRTYADAYEWKLARRNGVADWRNVWKTAPQRHVLPQTPQGEAISYNAEGTQFIVSSEGINAPLQWLQNGRK